MQAKNRELEEKIKMLEQKIEQLSKNKIEGILKTKGWYRVAKLKCSEMPQLSYLLSLRTMYQTNQNMSSTLAINTAYNIAKIACFNKIALDNFYVISKIRIVYETLISDWFVEIYYNSNSTNRVYVDFLNIDKNIELINFEISNDSMTVVTELTL